MADKLPDSIPSTFTPARALALGMTKRSLSAALSAGLAERIAWGIYRRTDADPADDDLIEVAFRVQDATLCLETVLARRDLSDLIPSRLDIAVPRGARFPAVRAPVAWHAFDRATFHIGRETIPLDSAVSIGIYSAERAIVDTVRLRHRQGSEVAYQAVRRYLSHPGSRPGELVTMARHWPRTEPEIRKILEILES